MAIPTVTNTATVAGGNEVNVTNNAATDPTIVNGIPDLTLTKGHTGNFTVGTPDTYALTTNNIGNAATTGTTTLTDTLPTGLTIPDGAVTLTGTNAANWSCIASGNVITCTSSTIIASSGSSTFNLTGIQVGAAAFPSVTNTAAVSGGGETNTSNNSASDATTVIAPDLTLSKTHSGNFTVGTSGSYSLTLNNAGTALTSGTITVTDTLPTGLTIPDGAVTLTGTNAANWSCSATSNVITCTSTTAIAASGNSTFTLNGIQVGAAAVPSVTNTASVAGGNDANTTNNTATDPTTVVGFPDLTIAKTHTGNFTQGQTGATYTLTATNSGSATTSGTITVIDTVPTELTATAASGTGWTCSLNMPTAGQVQCTRSDGLTAGSSYPSITLTVNVASNAVSSVTNNVSVSGGAETNTGNDTATDPTAINVPANVLLVKRITAINGDRTKNPNDDTPLNTFVDDTTSILHKTDDNNAGWPSSYLLGAIDAGKVKPGDDIEYTVYFLNAGGVKADSVKICDLIAGQQDFKPDAYGTNQDIALTIGKASNTPTFLTQADDVGDRAQVIAPNGTVPTSCNLKADNTTSKTIVLDVTGTTGAPALTTLKNTTGTGTPDDSFGFFRFTTTVKP